MIATRSKKREHDTDIRIRFASVALLAIMLVIAFRLFTLMVRHHEFYAALAAGTHELSATLLPKRGQIFIQDTRSGEQYPIAMNKNTYWVYVDPRHVPSERAMEVLDELTAFFGYTDERRETVLAQLTKENDPYELLEKKVEEEMVDRMKERKLPGIGFIIQSERFYPEGPLAAQVVGFVGKDSDGSDIGRYGIEGYWNNALTGQGGFLEGVKGGSGSMITLAGRSFQPAEDGADIVLTIDRSVQYHTCEELRMAMQQYQAESGSLLIMDPKTGAIRAVCSLPDFDPNAYGKVDNAAVYNNSLIFTPYEPGSIFKPLVMAAALEEGLVNPNTPFFDTGERGGVCDKPIRNAGQRSYGDQTMTGVLELSLNTGMVYVAELLGKERVRSYIDKFGFGVKTGIPLDIEASGNIKSLYANKSDKFDCYTATASYGQGVMMTPLQITAAFGTIANGGMRMAPYIIEEIRYADGKKEKTQPKELGRVVSERTASLLGAMMVKVVDNGFDELAKVPGYYVAGKTGTAQIPGPGGYTDETVHSFVGFAPVEDPKFVILITLEKPKVAYASSTVAPTFKKIATFLLDHYDIPATR